MYKILEEGLPKLSTVDKHAAYGSKILLLKLHQTISHIALLDYLKPFF